jgi:hypothetical protein
MKLIDFITVFQVCVLRSIDDILVLRSIDEID